MPESLVPKLDPSLLSTFSAAFEQLSEGVIVADAHGRLVFVNRRATELHGVKRLDVEPEDYADAYHLLTMEDAPYPSEELPLARTVIHGEVFENVRWKIKRPDASVIIAVGTSKPVLDSSGTQIASVLTIRDDTDAFYRRAELQEALENSRAMLVEINHRVKNNLQVVSSLLRVQTGRTADINALHSLGELSRRIDIVADVNRRLYETVKPGGIDAVGQLSDLSRNSLAELVSDKGGALSVSASGEFPLEIEKVVSLALALNELVVKSTNDAFQDAGQARISIDIIADEDGLLITYLDNRDHTSEGSIRSEQSGFSDLMLAGLKSQMNAHLAQLQKDRAFKLEIRLPALQSSLHRA